MKLAYDSLTKKTRSELLAMVRELTRDFSVQSPTEAVNEIREMITDWEREHVVILFLDNSGRILSGKLYEIGAAEGCYVYPKIIMRDAMMMVGCNRIIFGHNHPTGNLTFSTPDKQVINKLRSMSEVCDLRLDDAIVVTASSFASAREEGIL